MLEPIDDFDIVGATFAGMAVPDRRGSMRVARDIVVLLALVVGAPAMAEAPDAAQPAASARQPLRLTVREAVLMGLENNRGLRVERFTPAIRSTAEDQQAAVFDPSISASVSDQIARDQQVVRSTGSPTNADSDTISGQLTLAKQWATGTKLSLQATSSLQDSSLYSDQVGTTRAGLTLTQSLLRGTGSAANLASLRQARLDTRISEYELRGFTEMLIGLIESAYWNSVLALRQEAIYADALRVAEQQLSETEARIKVGKIAEVEIAAARAEVAARREGLIAVSAAREKARLNLLRLLNPPGADLWDRALELLDPPAEPAGPLDDVANHVRLGLQLRSDLNQARLAIGRGELEVVKTRNGLLPKLDLFITLGRTGYADSFNDSAQHVADEDHPDYSFGATLEYPLGNRDARARKHRATLEVEQTRAALANLMQLVEVDIRSAYIDVLRSKEEIAATAATRRYRDDALRAETEKFRVGKSTALLVAQAQRDYLFSQLAEVRSVVGHLQALIDLYRLEGSLLERRGIRLPD